MNGCLVILQRTTFVHVPSTILSGAGRWTGCISEGGNLDCSLADESMASGLVVANRRAGQTRQGAAELIRCRDAWGQVRAAIPHRRRL